MIILHRNQKYMNAFIKAESKNQGVVSHFTWPIWMVFGQCYEEKSGLHQSQYENGKWFKFHDGQY